MDRTGWIGLGFGLVIAAALWASDLRAGRAILPAAPAPTVCGTSLHTIVHRNRPTATLPTSP